MTITAKQEKAAVKEGEKKGVDLSGMSAMGGVKFFSVAVESACGEWAGMEAVLKGMNTEVDESADERKGGAGDLGKCLLFADEAVLLVLCHVPEERVADINAEEWFASVLEGCGAKKVEGGIDGVSGVVLKGVLNADPDKGVFPLKVRDVAINRSFDYLVSKMLVRPDESDDENYAEMAEIEW